MNVRSTATLLLVLSISALAQNRMPPIPADKRTPAQQKAVDLIASSPRCVTDSAQTCHGTGGPSVPLLRSPELLTRLQAVAEYLRYNNSVPQKQVEMTILMTARQSAQQYEWNAHYPLALTAGLPPETAQAIGAGRRPGKLAEDEEVVYDFVAELLQNKSVSDPTYARMVGKFGEQGVVDTTELVGYYATVAMMLNVARAPMQPNSTAPKLAPFPR